MASRLDLHAKLVGILGSQNVYYQPPTSLVLKYPCIIYARGDHWNIKASNKIYRGKWRYQLTVIDKAPGNDDPEQDTCTKLLGLDYVSYDRRFVSDNLYHDILNIYF